MMSLWTTCGNLQSEKRCSRTRSGRGALCRWQPPVGSDRTVRVRGESIALRQTAGEASTSRGSSTRPSRSRQPSRDMGRSLPTEIPLGRTATRATSTRERTQISPPIADCGRLWNTNSAGLLHGRPTCCLQAGPSGVHRRRGSAEPRVYSHFTSSEVGIDLSALTLPTRCTPLE